MSRCRRARSSGTARGPGRGAVRAGHAGFGDGGQVGGVEALAFGALIFVIGTLIIANAWGVIDAKMGAAGAAREAARAFVEAPTGADAQDAAEAAATQAVEAEGRNPQRMQLVISGTFARC